MLIHVHQTDFEGWIKGLRCYWQKPHSHATNMPGTITSSLDLKKKNISVVIVTATVITQYLQQTQRGRNERGSIIFSLSLTLGWIRSRCWSVLSVFLQIRQWQRSLNDLKMCAQYAKAHTHTHRNPDEWPGGLPRRTNRPSCLAVW